MSKRRTLRPEFKARVVLQELTGIKEKAGICGEYQLRPQVLSRWGRNPRNGLPRASPPRRVAAMSRSG
jgi:transposase-like protein